MKTRIHLAASLSARIGILVAIGTLLLSKTLPAAETKPSPIDAHADQWLKRMSDYLGEAKFFSVNAEVWQGFQLASGQRVQAGRLLQFHLRRPNHLQVIIQSPRRDRELLYDGSAITLLDRAHGFYGSVKTSGSLDDAMDTAIEKFGIAMPLEDFLRSNPHKDFLQKVNSGVDIGPVNVLGVSCEHLAFSQDNIDWQVWIEGGIRPVPRKFLITYKDEPDSPEFTAIFSEWDFVSAVPDFVFKFDPPPGMDKISVEEIKSQNLSRKTEAK
jgi:hypothetical protein